MSSHEARKLVEEVRGLEKNWMLDLGHPLLNRVADSFVKAAGVSILLRTVLLMPHRMMRDL